MKIALMMPTQWEPVELALISDLGEIVEPWTAGREVEIAVSRLPGGTRFYAWSREFGRKETWAVWTDTLEELVEKIKEELC